MFCSDGIESAWLIIVLTDLADLPAILVRSSLFHITWSIAVYSSGDNYVGHVGKREYI